MNDEYTSIADKLVERILTLIPEHPEILGLDSAWDLFNVPGFTCSDLGPTLAQAGWALAEAQRRYKS